ncbi:MAG: hypothetical protein U0800_17090 [Isosphaeraceae bacterium]
MHRARTVGGMFAIVALGLLAATARAEDDGAVVGRWKLSYQAGGSQREPVVTITKGKAGLQGEFAEGGKTYEARGVKFEKGKLRFTIVGEYMDEPTYSTFEGEVEGDAIEGDMEWKYREREASFPFRGKRQAASPKG